MDRKKFKSRHLKTNYTDKFVFAFYRDQVKTRCRTLKCERKVVTMILILIRTVHSRYNVYDHFVPTFIKSFENLKTVWFGFTNALKVKLNFEFL